LRDPHVGDYQHRDGDHCLDGGGNTLGTPIIIGLSGFNTAYIVQGRAGCAGGNRRRSRFERLASISADTAANNKRVTCQHHAADTADGHQDKKGNHGQFGCLHHVLLLLTEQLYGEAQLLMNH
jgi:osmoprotectant transport system permease protein